MHPDAQLEAPLQALLARCAAGDKAAVQGLYRIVAPLLFACLIRMLQRRALAEEALQDVFVSIWQRAGQFQPQRGHALAWMMSIARYRAIDLMRRERRAPLLVADTEELAETAGEAVSGPQAWMPAAGLLERCLALLTQQQRDCLELAFAGGNSHAEIARLVGSPLGTVKSWIRRALQELKGCLES